MFNLTYLIGAYGTLGVGLITFAESSVFPFLPGDSLLFTAGFLAYQKILPIYPLYFTVFITAILGNLLGYAVGRRYGTTLFSRPDSFLFKPEYSEKTRLFFQKHGSKAIIIARFVPIVRTFIPIFAGIGKMPFYKFLKYNIVGAFIWSTTLIWSGYYLSHAIPNSEKYIGKIAIAIIFVSIAPSLLSFFKDPENKTKIKNYFSKLLSKLSLR